MAFMDRFRFTRGFLMRRISVGKGTSVASNRLGCVKCRLLRTIWVRPSRNPRWQKQNGWEVYEGDVVSPVFCGDNGRESALSYAQQRAGYAPTEI
jgi:hypothetical protein